MATATSLDSPQPVPPAGSWIGAAMVGGSALAGGYLASSLGYFLILRPAGVVFLWPPSGVWLGVLLVVPRRYWPLILAGAFGGDVLAGPRIRIGSLRDVGAFLLGGVIVANAATAFPARQLARRGAARRSQCPDPGPRA